MKQKAVINFIDPSLSVSFAYLRLARSRYATALRAGVRCGEALNQLCVRPGFAEQGSPERDTAVLT